MNERFTFQEEVKLLKDMADVFAVLYRLEDVDHDELDIPEFVENSIDTRPLVFFTKENSFVIRGIKRSVYGQGGHSIEKCVEIDVFDVVFENRNVDEAAAKFTSSIVDLVNKRGLVTGTPVGSNLEGQERLLSFITMALREGWLIKVWLESDLGVYVCVLTPEDTPNTDIPATHVGGNSYLMRWRPKGR